MLSSIFYLAVMKRFSFNWIFNGQSFKGQNFNNFIIFKDTKASDS